MEAKRIDEVERSAGAIFVDNLMMCSADRLISNRYNTQDLETIDEPLPALLFLHDLVNLSQFIQSAICHERLYLNAEYIDRWNGNIWSSTLALPGGVIVPVLWSGSRSDVERL